MSLFDFVILASLFSVPPVFAVQCSVDCPVEWTNISKDLKICGPEWEVLSPHTFFRPIACAPSHFITGKTDKK